MAVTGVVLAGAMSILPLATGGAASASTSSHRIDLAATGSVVGGETNTESDHLLAFSYEATNKSSRGFYGGVDLVVMYIRNATFVDTMCVLPSTHFGFNSDGPTACEFPGLRAHRREYATFIVQPKDNAPLNSFVSMRVCVRSEGGSTDPVATNNCSTLRVKIV